MGGRPNHGAWCLSRDIIAHFFWYGANANGCYGTLKFAPSEKVYGWWHINGNLVTPNYGRRSLEEVPTAEDFQQCQADDSPDQTECMALVDQIFTYEMNHPEHFVLLSSDEDGLEIDSATGLAMVTPSTTSVDSWAVYGLAGVGFAFLMVQGASWFKRQTQK